MTSTKFLKKGSLFNSGVVAVDAVVDAQAGTVTNSNK